MAQTTPHDSFVCVVRRVPPHFSIPPENVEVMPGGSVNLTCVAIGSPMPFVKWRLGALELTPEANIPIGKNVLMLNDIRESATYTCVAASDLGNIESDAEVRVKGSSSSHTHTHTHTFNGPLSGTTQVSRYQKGKTNLDFTGARDSEWQWHQSAPGSRQITTPALHHSVFLQAGCPSCRPTNSVKALKTVRRRCFHFKSSL